MCIMGFITLFLLFSSAYCDEKNAVLDFTIEHSFDGGNTFSTKGNTPSWSDDKVWPMSNEAMLKPENLAFIQNSADKDLLYVVRLTGNDLLSYTMGSCRMCQVLSSAGRMSLTISVDASGAPIAVTVVPANQTCVRYVPPSQIRLQTSILLQRPALGHGPDTVDYMTKMERQRDEKMRQEMSDNRSFIAKYWMYILPVVFFFFILNSADSNSGGSD